MVSPAEEPEYLLPQEAFPLRHEIMDHPSAPEPMQENPESPHVSGNEAESMCLTPMESFSLISVSQLLFSPHLPPKFFCPIVKEMLCYYAEQGDVQMAVSVLIVLGDRIRKEIDELTQVKKNAHFDRKCRFLHVSCIRNRPLYLKYGTICGVRNHIGRSQVHSYSIPQCTAKTSVHPMYTQQLEITHNALRVACRINSRVSPEDDARS